MILNQELINNFYLFSTVTLLFLISYWFLDLYFGIYGDLFERKVFKQLKIKNCKLEDLKEAIRNFDFSLNKHKVDIYVWNESKDSFTVEFSSLTDKIEKAQEKDLFNTLLDYQFFIQTEQDGADLILSITKQCDRESVLKRNFSFPFFIQHCFIDFRLGGIHTESMRKFLLLVSIFVTPLCIALAYWGTQGLIDNGLAHKASIVSLAFALSIESILIYYILKLNYRVSHCKKTIDSMFFKTLSQNVSIEGGDDGLN